MLKVRKAFTVSMEGKARQCLAITLGWSLEEKNPISLQKQASMQQKVGLWMRL